MIEVFCFDDQQPFMAGTPLAQVASIMVEHHTLSLCVCGVVQGGQPRGHQVPDCQWPKARQGGCVHQECCVQQSPVRRLAVFLDVTVIERNRSRVALHVQPLGFDGHSD